MEENEIVQLELTEKTVPKAVGYLINEVAEMRATLDKMEKQLGLGINKHRPILIEQAAEILQMKVGTVRRLADERNIPHTNASTTSTSLKMSLLNGSKNPR